MNGKAKKKVLADQKNWLTYTFWTLVNIILIAFRFRSFQIIGRENLPKDGGFLLVANHTSRWDGLLVYRAVNRPANFMVSPNELKGLQGTVLTSMGAFPADPRFGIIEYAREQMRKGEPVIIFPEGNIFTDGITHPFKNGAAKVAMTSLTDGLDIPVIPAAINYAGDRKVAQIVFGEPVSLSTYVDQYAEDQIPALRTLSDRMHREVCLLRETLGSVGDRLALYGNNGKQAWRNLVKNLSVQPTATFEFPVP
jgi:1-acyl-sn-glycerol-3-phosphate acyltransferase